MPLEYDLKREYDADIRFKRPWIVSFFTFPTIFFVLGFICLTKLSPDFLDWFLGVLAALIGVSLSLFIAIAVIPGAVRITLDDAGVALWMKPWGNRAFRWTDPRLHFTLTVEGGGPDASVSNNLPVRTYHLRAGRLSEGGTGAPVNVTISEVALHGILSMARTRGVSILTTNRSGAALGGPVAVYTLSSVAKRH